MVDEGTDPDGAVSSESAWLADGDGDGFDDLFGLWIGGYEGPIAPEYLPEDSSDTNGVLAFTASLGFFDLALGYGWPDGGTDSDYDGLSDEFESANSWTEEVFHEGEGYDPDTVTYEIEPWSEWVTFGLDPDNADSDGDQAGDGVELLTLSATMQLAGRPRFDPLVGEANRDDDADDVPTIEEFLVWGSSPLWSSPRKLVRFE